VKGAIDAYRFFRELPEKTREEMAAFYEASGRKDRLYQLFLSLGEETNIARATHLLRDTVAKTHSFNYVRYPDTSLAGKVIVITGGGTGMGRVLALEASIRGANVVITGRRPEPLEETKADMDDLISHLGLTNRTLTVQGDVSDPKYVGEMFDRISREFGRIDILYNNAGVSGPVEFGSIYQEEHFELYREAVNVHLTGAWLASLEAAKRMEKQKEGGLIVMVGTFYCESIHRHVLHAYPGRLPYTSAQSAKLALGDYLSWVLAEKNITVLSLNPSAVSTERIQTGSGVFDKGSLARARIGRHVPPESLRRDTLDRTVSHEFVLPRDFARVALDIHRIEFQRTVGGQRIPSISEHDRKGCTRHAHTALRKRPGALRGDRPGTRPFRSEGLSRRERGGGAGKYHRPGKCFGLGGLRNSTGHKPRKPSRGPGALRQSSTNRSSLSFHRERRLETSAHKPPLR
jgi:NAD(P)-dependent dehydrogenase (short-subunit alcohol dehydrogenase family)